MSKLENLSRGRADVEVEVEVGDAESERREARGDRRARVIKCARLHLHHQQRDRRRLAGAGLYLLAWLPLTCTRPDKPRSRLK